MFCSTFTDVNSSLNTVGAVTPSPMGPTCDQTIPMCHVNALLAMHNKKQPQVGIIIGKRPPQQHTRTCHLFALCYSIYMCVYIVTYNFCGFHLYLIQCWQQWVLNSGVVNDLMYRSDVNQNNKITIKPLSTTMVPMTNLLWVVRNMQPKTIKSKHSPDSPIFPYLLKKFPD